MRTLRDCGERYLLRHIVPEYCDGSGDDCAVLEIGSENLIVTTDPVPLPAAQVIGGDADTYWLGWLLVIINSSDLAASGAEPLGFVSALELPSDLPLESFRRLLAGTKQACSAEGLRYIGGNLKEGSKISAVGTALGRCRRGRAISRRGARSGDLLVSIGAGGVFWRDALLTINNIAVKEKRESPLFAPRSQINVMHKLAEQDLICAAMDNSDGLLPTLTELARMNSIGITLDLVSLRVEGADLLNIDPARLWLGWGDWNVLAAVSRENVEAARFLAREVGTQVTTIGHFHGTTPDVFLKRGETTIPAPRLESERFAADSWFSEGIDGYIDRLLSMVIPE